MAQQVRTLDFLPSIFKTETNQQFLAATLDVLTSQPDMKTVQGYIGNRHGYAISPTDKYVVEPTKERSDYQFDPAVTFQKKDTSVTTDFIDYPGIVRALRNQGWTAQDHNKLFTNKLYSWDSFINLDKAVNFSQYYWLPLGPDAIKLSDTLDVTQIIGQKTYTTPSGLTLINGLKIDLGSNVKQEAYRNKAYYVQGVGTSIELIAVTEMLCTEITGGGMYIPWDNDPYDTTDWSITLYVPIQPDYITIDRASADRNAWSRSNRWFHQNVIDTHFKYNGYVTANQYNTQTRASRPIIEFQSDLRMFDSGTVSAGIVNFLDTRETNAMKNVNGASSFSVLSSVVRTSRSVTDFGIIVNDTTYLVKDMPVTFTALSGKLPTGLTAGTTYYVRQVDHVQRSIAVSTSTYEGGAPLVNVKQGEYNLRIVGESEIELGSGTRIVFASDEDERIRKTVFDVKRIKTNNVEKISLTPVVGVTVDTDSQIYIAQGPGDYLGTAWRWGTTPTGETGWIESQKKTAINQAPLFDAFDATGVSFSTYTNSAFSGTKLFSYTIGSSTATNDAVLGFSVEYSSPANTGDFLFTVNLNSDTFTYTNAGATVTKNISDGFIHQTVNGATVKRTGWVESVAQSQQYQINVQDITIATAMVTLDVLVSEQTSSWSPVQVYKNGDFISTADYTVTRNTKKNITNIVFDTELSAGDQVSVLFISEQVSPTSKFQIPSNMTNNPFNEQLKSVANGDLNNYYGSIFRNSPGLTGVPNGINNFSEAGDLTRYGTAIVQNSASLVLPATFLRNPEFNLVHALQHSAVEYSDYKAKIVELAAASDYSVRQSPAEILDDIIYRISSTKNEKNSFYWSDMLVSGSPYKTSTVTYEVDITTAVFKLSRVYDYTTANYYGLAVYLTTTSGSTEQLLRGRDYTVSTTDSSLLLTRAITRGSTVTVREYNQTWGSYVPNTPTKLGLYQAFAPRVVTEQQLDTVIYMIQGHDGSLTKLYGTFADGKFNDFRDIALLEFETRIFNNLKIAQPAAIGYADIFPGEWRKTHYTFEELLPAYTKNFLSWVGRNRISNWRKQTFIRNDKFSYNYGKSTNKLSGGLLKQGGWRGIYQWFYDTVDPARQPWQMLGLADKPTWWESRYGVAPYTSGNEVMWQDIADGLIWNDGNPIVNQRFVRPGLLDALPVNELGELVDPLERIVGNYDSLTFNRDWTVGDMGPTEAAYRRSSTWPFDLVKLLSTFRPADFYNLCADLDTYKYNSDLQQFVFNDRYRLDPRQLTVYGAGTAKHSYMNWVVDYIKRHGNSGQEQVQTALQNTDVRMIYKIGGFSDKQFLRFLTENTAPSATQTNLVIPDDSYSILLYDDVPVDTVVYSSVIIQKTNSGYQVWGNSLVDPYFHTVEPKAGLYEKITINRASVELSTVYDPTSTVPIAYGTEFYTTQGVSEFIRNYGRWQAEHGVIFDNLRGTDQVDWNLMIKEFLAWAQQEWEVGSTISLNPNAREFKAYKAGTVPQPLTLGDENFVLNQNLVPLAHQDMAVIRDNETLTVRILSDGDSVAFTNINLATIEHAVVFDNQTIFGDTIYSPASGLRQARLIIQGQKTANWSGYVNAHGFILNQSDIKEWSKGNKYAKGQIVTYKNEYWSAIELIEAGSDFDYTQWSQSNYDDIRQGLLPNPSTIASESIALYNPQQANLEQDEDLLAFGLIGFRPRKFFADAALTDTAQVRLYQQMIQGKGTKATAETFVGATPLQGELDYDVRENWAILNGQFGSVLNSNFVEVKLYKNLLTGNPSTIGFGDSSPAPTISTSINGVSKSATVSLVSMPSVGQKVAVGDTKLKDNVDVTGYSYQNELINFERPPVNANFLPLFTSAYNDERGLPTAGYVNIDDTDWQAYTLSDLNDVTDAVSKLYRGDYVWVANYKDTWNVFTPVSIGTTVSTVTNNFNKTVTVEFAQPHGLVANDPITIIDFNSNVDGYYQVSSVPSLSTIVLPITLAKTVKSLTGTGITFKLQAVRMAQASDLAKASNHVKYSEFASRLRWIDDDSTGNWAVYEGTPEYQYTYPKNYDFSTTVAQDTYSADAYYGTSVAYANDRVLTLGNNVLYANGGLVKFYTVSNDTPAITTYDVTMSLKDASVAQVVATCTYDITLNADGTRTVITDRAYIANPGTGFFMVDFGSSEKNNGITYYKLTEVTHADLIVANGVISVSDAVKSNKANTGNTTYTETQWVYLGGANCVFVYKFDGTTFHYVNKLQAPTSGWGFGKVLTTSADGSKLIVGAPLAVGTKGSNEGTVYFYDRASRSYIQDIIGKQVFTIETSIIDKNTTAKPRVGAVAVYINSELIPTTDYSFENYTTLRFNTAPPVGSTIYVDFSNLVLQQVTVSKNPNIGIQYGKSVTTSRYGAEVFVGAPYEMNNVDDHQNVQGAVYRWTNLGQRYGKVYATVSSTANVFGTIFIDGFAVPYDSQDMNDDTAIVALGYTASPRNRVAYQINSIEPTNVVADYSNTTDVITITNKPGTTATADDQIDLVGATMTDLTNLGITAYTNIQTIYDIDYDSVGQFGYTVAMSRLPGKLTDAILVGAPNDKSLSETTFDFTDDYEANDTIFDNGATTFVEETENAGSVYQYVYMPTAEESADKPGMFVFGQYCNPITQSAAEITARGAKATVSRYGEAIAYHENVIVIGSKNWYENGAGRVLRFTLGAEDPKSSTASVRHSTWYENKRGLPQVDANRLTSVSLYDTLTNSTLEYLDYIDPVQGKMLSAIEINSDYIGSHDPADYTSGVIWAKNKVGHVWIDTTELRMMNYNQTYHDAATDTIVADVAYNSKYFGKAFPGSTVGIYTWVESTVTPTDYQGSGYVTNLDKFVTTQYFDNSTNSTKYLFYFWVKNYDEIPEGKTISPANLAQYILDPKSSGIPFLVALTTNVIALFNTQDSIQDGSTALHLGYSIGSNPDQGHTDWSLIQDGDDGSFLQGLPLNVLDEPTGMYLKYLTSFMGLDLTGAVVPDPALPALARYGTSFRPRQSMFIDRALALKNFVQYANNVAAKYPISEIRGVYLLNQEQYITVEVTANSTSRLYISNSDGTKVTGLYAGQPITFKDNAYGGLAVNTTYYIKEASGVSTIGTDIYGQYIRLSATPGGSAIQLNDYFGSMSGKLFDTAEYWEYTYWWADGYSADTKVMFEVDSYTDLLTLSAGGLYVGATGTTTISDGLVVRVAKNGAGVNEIYVYSTADGWTRVGLQDSTIKIKSKLYTQTDPIPSKEIYYIVRWINEQLYENETTIERNQSLITMFNYIQSEALQDQNYLTWLNKTSLVDVEHTIRQLKPYKKYQRDATQLVEGYLNEVKPYHVHIKAFAFHYDDIETYQGSFTDFDLPSRYITSRAKFESPQLLLTNAAATADNQYTKDDAEWTQTIYQDWLANHGLSISNSQTAKVLVSSLTYLVKNTDIYMVLDETGVLPAFGTVKIGDEVIEYNKLDRKTNTISDLRRNTTYIKVLPHEAGTLVYLLPTLTNIMDEGRGYISAPKVSVYYDTTEYPYGVRTEAILHAHLESDYVRSVEVVEPGSGYPTLPEVRVSQSSINSFFNSTQVDHVLSQIYMVGHNFQDGDCVTVVNIQDDSATQGLKNYRYYYLKIVDDKHIALYDSYKDSLTGYTTTEIEYGVQSVTWSPTLMSDPLYVTYPNPIGGNPLVKSYPFITLEDETSIDNLPFRTGDYVRVTTERTPDVPEYYYVETIGVASTDLVESNYRSQQRIALHSTLEEARAGLNDTRVVVGSLLSISAVPETDKDRVNFAEGDQVAGTLGVTARVKIYTDNIPVREMKVAMKFDRTSFKSNATDWEASITRWGVGGWDSKDWSKGKYYSKGDLVVFSGSVFRANIDLKTDELTREFDFKYWDEIDGGDISLNALDRIVGFYKPRANMPGFTTSDMSQLMSGTKFPYQTVKDASFSEGKTYTFVPNQVDLDTNSITIYTTEPRVASYQEAIISVNGSSEFTTTRVPVAIACYTGNNAIILNDVATLAVGNKVRFVADLIDEEALDYNVPYTIASVDSGIRAITLTGVTITANATGWGSLVIDNTFSTTGTRTDAGTTTGGTITLATTANIATGYIVQFNTADVFGNIDGKKQFYVQSVESGNKIKIAETFGGPAVTYIDTDTRAPISPSTTPQPPMSITIVPYPANARGDYYASANARPTLETTYVTGDLVKAIYTSPTARTTSYYYARNVGNKITLHPTPNDATANLNKVTVPRGTLGRLVKPQTVIALADPIDDPIGTVTEVIYSDSYPQTDFGLINNVNYWMAVVDDNSVAIYESKDEAENDYNRVPLLTLGAGQLSTIVYDSLVGNPGMSEEIDIKGMDFEYGFSPEELVAGVVTDGINMTVKTIAGATWNQNLTAKGAVTTTNMAHTGFNMVKIKGAIQGAIKRKDGTVISGVSAISFRDVVANPVSVTVYRNVGITQTRLIPQTDNPGITAEYTVNWVDQYVEIVTPGTDTFDIVVYEYGNGVHLVRGTTDNYPLRSVKDYGKTNQYHSEIELDIPYSQIDLPSDENYWLSVMVHMGTSSSDAKRLTYITNFTDAAYGETDPASINYGHHYSIQPVRALDPVNDPFNPAKIVFNKFYVPTDTFVSFAIATNVLGHFVVGGTHGEVLENGVLKTLYNATAKQLEYQVPVVGDVTDIAIYKNDAILTPADYTAVTVGTTLTVTFADEDINFGDIIKVTDKRQGGISVPVTQHIVSTQGASSNFTETINLALRNVAITGTGGQFTCQSTQLSTDLTKLTMYVTLPSGTTYSGTGSISGFSTASSGSKIYKLSATNGKSSFTLVNEDGSAVTTTAGTTTGLVFTLAKEKTVQRTTLELTEFLGDDNYSAITVDRIENGIFRCASTTRLEEGMTITLTGTSEKFDNTKKYHQGDRIAGDGTNGTAGKVYSVNGNTIAGKGFTIGTGTHQWTLVGDLATIVGYNSPKVYYIAISDTVQSTDGYTYFKLSSYFGGTADVVTTDGYIAGMTFSTQNNLIVEINGLRYDGPAPTQVYRKIIHVDKNPQVSYPAPVYGISDFDIGYFTVQVNGAEIPQVDPADATKVNWNVNYDFQSGTFYQFDADFINANFFQDWDSALTYDIGYVVVVGSSLYRAVTSNTNKPPAANTPTDWALTSASEIFTGLFDDGTPFDNKFSFNVVFNPNETPLYENDIVTLSYQVPGETPPDLYTITTNANKIGGKINVLTQVFPTSTSTISVTTFGRTTDQKLSTQRITDATVSYIPVFNSTLAKTAGGFFKGLQIDSTQPPLVTFDNPHNLLNGQLVFVSGEGINPAFRMNNRKFYVSTVNYFDSSSVQDVTRQMYLYNVDPTVNRVWNNTTTYYDGDVVFLGSKYYVALKSNVNKNPTTEVLTWAETDFWVTGSSSLTARTPNTNSYVQLIDNFNPSLNIAKNSMVVQPQLLSDWQIVPNYQGTYSTWVNGQRYESNQYVQRDGVIYRSIVRTSTPPSAGIKFTNVDRLFVSVIDKDNDYLREYIPASKLQLQDINGVNTLIVEAEIVPGDKVLVTSFVPTASPNETRFRINQTWSTVTGTPNTPVIYRENAYTRTYITSVSYDADGIAESFKVKDPFALVSLATFSATGDYSARTVTFDTDAGLYATIIDGLESDRITNLKFTKPDGSSINTGFEWFTLTNVNTTKVYFYNNPGSVVYAQVASGNEVLINGENLRFKEINIDYTSPDFGKISGLQRGRDYTRSLAANDYTENTDVIAEHIVKYAQVQGVLEENKMSAKRAISTFYDRVVTRSITARDNSTGVYTFSYDTNGVNTIGTALNDRITQLSTGDKISFYNGATKCATFVNNINVANTVATTGKFNFLVSDNSDIRYAQVGSDITFTYTGNSKEVKYYNPVTRETSNVFTIVDSYYNTEYVEYTAASVAANKQDSSVPLVKKDIWTIEIAEPLNIDILDSSNPVMRANVQIFNEYTISSVVQNAGNVVITLNNVVEIDNIDPDTGDIFGNVTATFPTTIVADSANDSFSTASILRRVVDLPLVIETTGVAEFLNQQIR
jgi:hypothetical protein